MNKSFQELLTRSYIGSKELADWVSNSSSHSNYPPYNIEKLDDEHYRLTMACAGFKKEDLSVNSSAGHLEITARNPDTQERDYVYRGMALRDFRQTFKLDNYMMVDSATVSDGLLTIDISVQLPEYQRTRSIEIK